MSGRKLNPCRYSSIASSSFPSAETARARSKYSWSRSRRLESAISRPQLLRIQPAQLRRRENAVFADELVIEVDLAAAVVFSLNADHVPVHLAAVAVVGFVVRLAGREVEAAGDLFVEEDVLHRLHHVRVETERPFADVARALVGVENLIELLRVRVAVGRRGDDLPALKFQADAVEDRAAIHRFAVVLDHAVHAVANRARIALAVRNIPLAPATHRADSFDAEVQ